MKTPITRTWILTTLAVATIFTAGYATGQSLFATTLNRTLAQAFHLTGQALFGNAAFGTTIPESPPDPNQPLYGSTSPIPLASQRSSSPAGPCPWNPAGPFLQIALTGGKTTIKLDPDTAPGSFNPDLLVTDLSQVRPRTSQCPRAQ